MRRTLAQIGFLAVAFLLTDEDLVNSQQSTTNVPSEIKTDAPCTTLHTKNEEPPAAGVSIVEVRFVGSLQMSVPNQDQIADSIKQQTRGTIPDAVKDEALERARAAWQDRGYFKVQVSGETKTLTSNPVSQNLLLIVHVDEGSQYTLRKITFVHNKAIMDMQALRGFFSIKDGEIFSREKIAAGLQNLREAYGELGYINFTAVPDTELNDEEQMISLKIDFDEGKQFYVSRIDVLGLDEAAKQELLSDLPIKHGQIFSSRLWEKSLLKYASTAPDCPCRLYEPHRFDEHSATVAVTLDFRPCSD